MRKRVSAAVVLAAAATVLVTAGAGTGSATTSRIDLRDAAAVDSYLRSIGIDPATVVRQTGLLNYAGPNCPGAGWNCTTSSRVVQVAQPGGTNTFEFSSTSNSNDDCMAMQDGEGGQNKAHCKLRSTDEPTASQSASIQQFNASRNLAIVDFDIQQKTGPTQTATQQATVTQDASDKNDVQIKETVKQSTSAGLTQTQEIQQVASVDQSATGSSNFAHVHQDQDQRESGSATDQNQNTGPEMTDDLPDCASGGFNSKTDPNACAYITQDANGGRNDTNLHQTINQDQSTNGASASQEQGSISTDNGIEGEIDQTNPDDVGSNLKKVHQDHRQRQVGPSGTTSQRQDIDPNCCGVGTTIGGADNIDDFNQTAIQSATEGENADQTLFITGDTNHVGEASLLSLASNNSPNRDRCTITHKAANNTDSTHGTIREEPCGFLVVETSCQNFPAYEGESEGCVGPEEVSDELSALSTVFSLPSTATLGLPIAAPSFGEPASFTGPLFTGI